MSKKWTMILAVACYSTLPAPSQLRPVVPDSLQITETPDSYELTVPVSRLVMTIPRAGLAPGQIHGGATNGPRYFAFEDKGEDKTRRVIISRWFESSDRYPGPRQLLSGVTAPQAVSFLKVGEWQAVSYEMPIRPAVNNCHLRAHWVQAGTWIDIHLSITSESLNKAELKSQLDGLLKSIRVTAKPPGTR